MITCAKCGARANEMPSQTAGVKFRVCPEVDCGHIEKVGVPVPNEPTNFYKIQRQYQGAVDYRHDY